MGAEPWHADLRCLAVLGSLVIILLLLVLAATWPAWPYSREWGYLPTGAAALALVVALILVFSGYLVVYNPFAAPS